MNWLKKKKSKRNSAVISNYPINHPRDNAPKLPTISPPPIPVTNTRTSVQTTTSSTSEEDSLNNVLAMTDNFVKEQQKAKHNKVQQELLTKTAVADQNHKKTINKLSIGAKKYNASTLRDRGTTAAFASALNQFVSNDAGDLDAVVQQMNTDHDIIPEEEENDNNNIDDDDDDIKSISVDDYSLSPQMVAINSVKKSKKKNKNRTNSNSYDLYRDRLSIYQQRLNLRRGTITKLKREISENEKTKLAQKQFILKNRKSKHPKKSKSVHKKKYKIRDTYLKKQQSQQINPNTDATNMTQNAIYTPNFQKNNAQNIHHNNAKSNHNNHNNHNNQHNSYNQQHNQKNLYNKNHNHQSPQQINSVSNVQQQNNSVNNSQQITSPKMVMSSISFDVPSSTATASNVVNNNGHIINNNHLNNAPPAPPVHQRYASTNAVDYIEDDYEPSNDVEYDEWNKYLIRQQEELSLEVAYWNLVQNGMNMDNNNNDKYFIERTLISQLRYWIKRFGIPAMRSHHEIHQLKLDLVKINEEANHFEEEAVQLIQKLFNAENQLIDEKEDKNELLKKYNVLNDKYMKQINEIKELNDNKNILMKNVTELDAKSSKSSKYNNYNKPKLQNVRSGPIRNYNKLHIKNPKPMSVRVQSTPPPPSVSNTMNYPNYRPSTPPATVIRRRSTNSSSQSHNKRSSVHWNINMNTNNNKHSQTQPHSPISLKQSQSGSINMSPYIIANKPSISPRYIPKSRPLPKSPTSPKSPHYRGSRSHGGNFFSKDLSKQLNVDNDNDNQDNTNKKYDELEKKYNKLNEQYTVLQKEIIELKHKKAPTNQTAYNIQIKSVPNGWEYEKKELLKQIEDLKNRINPNNSIIVTKVPSSPPVKSVKSPSIKSPSIKSTFSTTKTYIFPNDKSSPKGDKSIKSSNYQTVKTTTKTNNFDDNNPIHRKISSNRVAIKTDVSLNENDINLLEVIDDNDNDYDEKNDNIDTDNMVEIHAEIDEYENSDDGWVSEEDDIDENKSTRPIPPSLAPIIPLNMNLNGSTKPISKILASQPPSVRKPLLSQSTTNPVASPKGLAGMRFRKPPSRPPPPMFAKVTKVIVPANQLKTKNIDKISAKKVNNNDDDDNKQNDDNGSNGFNTVLSQFINMDQQKTDKNTQNPKAKTATTVVSPSNKSNPKHQRMKSNKKMPSRAPPSRALPSRTIIANVKRVKQHYFKPKKHGYLNIILSDLFNEKLLLNNRKYYCAIDGLPSSTNIDPTEPEWKKRKDNDILVPFLCFFRTKILYDKLVIETKTCSVRDIKFQKKFSIYSAGIIRLDKSQIDFKLDSILKKIKNINDKNKYINNNKVNNVHNDKNKLFVFNNINKLNIFECSDEKSRNQWFGTIQNFVNKRKDSLSRGRTHQNPTTGRYRMRLW